MSGFTTANAKLRKTLGTQALGKPFTLRGLEKMFPAFIGLTALNASDEESALSTEVEVS